MVDFNNTVDIVARTAWGENRGGGSEGMQSVINVVQNRAAKGGWWGSTMLAVCLFPNQFDCWIADNNPTSDYHATLNVTIADPDFAVALNLASRAVMGTLPDITGGATMYYAKSMAAPPYWAATATFTREIAGQLFYV